MKKTYIHENVTFGSTGPKWLFRSNSGSFEYRTALQGGLETAQKVAAVVNGSLKRTHDVGLDNLGRANIRTINERVKLAIAEQQAEREERLAAAFGQNP